MIALSKILRLFPAGITLWEKHMVQQVKLIRLRGCFYSKVSGSKLLIYTNKYSLEK